MTEAKRILLVDPDDLLRRTLADQLAGQGFAVSEAISTAQAVSADPVDLVLADSLLAAELCAALQGNNRRVPILALGASGPAAATLLTAGASECLAKPFRLSALVARLQAHLRDAPAEQTIRIGGFLFHPTARRLVDVDGRRIGLTEKEVAILTYLHEAGARVVPREELLGEVWGYRGAVSTHTVETHIYRLRQKLGDNGTAVLLTETGGYRLADNGI